MIFLNKSKKLLKSIENLKKGKVKELVDFRIKEFKNMGKKSNDKLFKELSFCILTANFNAERCIDLQNRVGNQLLNSPENELAQQLTIYGHRFPTVRAKYIVEARKYKDSLKNIINSENDPREWLIRNVKGIGYKEASHFLRNIGFENYAIIDFHIIDLLVRYNLIERPKTLTKKKYLEIEQVLNKIAEKTNLNLAQLDLYLWYLETGKVLK